MTLRGLALAEIVKARALELGFDRVAVGPAGAPETGAAFERWLDAGYAGTMAYLDEGRAERLDPSRLLPGWRSVVAVALNYARDDDGDDWRPVARYARGRDYHKIIRPRLHALKDCLRAAGGPGVRSRAAVDTSAVLERDLAVQVGLGWIGKNTNLIVPGVGSLVLLGIVLTTADLDADERVADHCGTCVACLQACPTGAFVDPYVLDARRCISYLTIEHRGDIDEPLRDALADWAFGCDVCQDVCPWNRKAEVAREPALAPSQPLGPLAALLDLDDAGFRERFRGTAIRRARRAGLLRNVALALGARREAGAAPALRRALADVDASVRRAAAWALARIGAAADA